MDQTIQILLKDITICSTEEKTSRLRNIGNYIKSRPNTEDIISVAQNLVDLLPQENDQQARKLLFKNISIAYNKKADLSIQLTPIVNLLDESGPAFICETLHLLSITRNKKYWPVISRYLYHTDEIIREEAVNALTYLQYNPSQKH